MTVTNGRRAKGEGRIHQRPDGRWCARYTLPGGKRRYVYAKTQKEARRLLTAALKALDDGMALPSGNMPFARFADDWLRTVKPSIKPQTWSHYDRFLRVHAVPALGRIQLAKLDRHHVQRLYTDKLASGLSSTSVRHLHSVIRRSLNDALRWGLVVRNIALMADPPSKTRYRTRTLTAAEARKLVAAAATDRLGALYVLALTTGMRKGELLALRWPDIDLDSGVLGVRSTLYRADGKLTIDDPKTAGSRRLIHLTPDAVSTLRQHHRRQEVERQFYGRGWDDTGLVFANTKGRPLEGGNVLQRSFYPLLERAGVPRVRFHDLRHSAATLLLGAGINPKVVAEMLGHSNISVTLDTYSHVTPGMHRHAAAAMSALLHAANLSTNRTDDTSR